MLPPESQNSLLTRNAILYVSPNHIKISIPLYEKTLSVWLNDSKLS